MLLDIGHKIFGLNDTAAVIDRNDHDSRMSAIVPTALLVASRKVRAFELFAVRTSGPGEMRPEGEPCLSDEYALPDFALDAAVEQVTLLAVDKKGTASYLLVGNGLAHAKVVGDTTVRLQPLDGVPGDRMVLLEVPKAFLATHKKLVLQKLDANKVPQRPILLDLPPPTPQAKPALPKIGLDSPVVQNTDLMVVPVEKVANLDSVTMDGTKLSSPVVAGKDAVLLNNLRQEGVTSEQKTRHLVFTFNNGTTETLALEVVAQRVGVK